MLRKTIRISLSTHFDTYVASFVPLLLLKLEIPFISPIVPIDIKSSISIFEDAYFLATCATNLKFLSIKIFLASLLPFLYKSKYFFSSSKVNGSGNNLLLDIYPKYVYCAI